MLVQVERLTRSYGDIRAVDEKRSLAVNPLRNRVVDPADLDLYEKYLAELPADKEMLKEFESRLEAIK